MKKKSVIHLGMLYILTKDLALQMYTFVKIHPLYILMNAISALKLYCNKVGSKNPTCSHFQGHQTVGLKKKFNK